MALRSDGRVRGDVRPLFPLLAEAHVDEKQICFDLVERCVKLWGIPAFRRGCIITSIDCVLGFVVDRV